MLILLVLLTFMIEQCYPVSISRVENRINQYNDTVLKTERNPNQEEERLILKHRLLGLVSASKRDSVVQMLLNCYTCAKFPCCSFFHFGINNICCHCYMLQLSECTLNNWELIIVKVTNQEMQAIWVHTFSY